MAIAWKKSTRTQDDFHRPIANWPLLLSVLLTQLALGIVYSGWSWPLERFVYDLQINFRPAPAPDDLLIIEIDEKSLHALGRWPWPRAVHARLLNRLNEAGVRVIGLDLIFAEPDPYDPQGDAALATAIREHGSVVLPVAIEALQTLHQLIEVLPFPLLAESAAALGHVHTELDPDGIARAVYLRQGLGGPYWAALAVEVLRLYQPRVGLQLPGLESPVPASASPLVTYRDNYILIPYAGPPGHFIRFSYVDVLRGNIPTEALRAKIVLIGVTATGLGDFLPAPVSGSGQPMPGVEIIANVFEGLRSGRTITPLPQSWHVALTALFVFFPVLWLMRASPHLALTITGFSAFGTVAFSTLLLHQADLWFPPAAATLIILVAYPLWSWSRLAFTVNFLQRSLDRLSQDPALERSLRDTDQIERMLAFWSRILPLDGWVLQTAAGETINRQGRAPAPTRYHGQRHDPRISWLQLNVADNALKIGLSWGAEPPAPLRRSALLRQLEQHKQAGDKSVGAVELIEKRSLQVQEATDRLRMMRRFISDCLAQMSDGVLVGDGLGRILMANRQIATLLPELNQHDPHPPAVLDVLEALQISAVYTWEQLLHGVLVDQHSATLEARSQTGRELLVTVAPLALGEELGPGYIVNVADVSTLKEEERRRAETLHFLSHDLRSPMVSMLALVEQARLKPDRLDIDDLLARIENFADKNLEMAEQFLQLVRAESSTAITFYEIGLYDLAENAVEQVLVQAQRKRIEITVDSEAEQGPWISGDAELLERAIINLLTNAIKYSPPDTRVSVIVAADAATACCCVKDQGYGFPQDALPKLFERFTRFHAKQVPGERGTGLGLRFVKSVVERHGGEISIDSQPGKGSAFCLKFPRLP